jgi:hypothetical protein
LVTPLVVCRKHKIEQGGSWAIIRHARGISISMSAETASDWQRWWRIAPSHRSIAGGCGLLDGGGAVWHCGDHAPRRRFRALCVALARALRGEGVAGLQTRPESRTSRLSKSPSSGIVNADGRVYHLENLYVTRFSHLRASRSNVDHRGHDTAIGGTS